MLGEENRAIQVQGGLPSLHAVAPITLSLLSFLLAYALRRSILSLQRAPSH